MDQQKRLKEFGPWSEQTSSSGKRYYYNRETEISQWEKPPEWREYERALAENALTPTTSVNIGNNRTSNTRQSVANNNQQNAVKTTPSTHNRFEREERERKVETVSNVHNNSQNVTAQDQKGNSTPQAAAALSRNDQSMNQKSQDDEFRKYAKYARPELISHLKGWKGDFYASESRKVHQNVNNISAQLSTIDNDIKTVNSLVFIAETKSKLLNRKLNFVRQQLEGLENSVISIPSMNT
uniref:WW domain-containing protein n=1 Tax=Acrobeloides nanus TaxID=290746 RepID=A0A914C1R8_9BILA